MQANVNVNPGGSMKKASHELEKEDTDQVWSVEGNFRHPVYSPRGGIEGVVIDADGIPAQFAFEPGNEAASAFAGMNQGERLVLEGTEAGAPPKGEAAHAVYQFVRIAGIGGVVQEPEGPGEVEGTIVRFNHARHGEPNGVVLDSGDFVHVRPDHFARLDLEVGQRISAAGHMRPLAHGGGRVVDAAEINGERVGHEARP
jgi:hypothetical protein